MSSRAGKEAARRLWSSVGLGNDDLSRLKFTGNPDTAINSSFRLGVAAQAAIGISGLAAVQFHFLRTGTNQEVTVDARHAVLECHSEAWYTLDGKLPEGGIWDSIAGVYRTKDGGFVRIHTNFPHHRQGILSILNIPNDPPPTRAELRQALLEWDAIEFETRAAYHGMCATALRSFTQWDEHPQAKSLDGVPPVMLIKIGDAPKRKLPTSNAQLPLDGIRALDLSRVLAGPIAGRTLAAQGADVLLITSPNLPALPLIDVETSLGKRTTQLDLTLPTDCERLAALAKDSDIFLQAYRPGGLEVKGFGTRDLVNLRPGIICANLTAWGWNGPWKDRRGFDSLVQTATGFNTAEAEAYREFQGLKTLEGDTLEPKPFPMQALDHCAAYLLAFGVNAALCKTITEGGSWEVRVSLAAVGAWVRSLGRLSAEEAFGKGRPFPPRVHPQATEIADLSLAWCQWGDNVASGVEFRKITAMRQAALLSATPAKEGQLGGAPIVLNAHSPSWLSRLQ